MVVYTERAFKVWNYAVSELKCFCTAIFIEEICNLSTKIVIWLLNVLMFYSANQYFLNCRRNAIPWYCRGGWGSGAATPNNETGHGSSVCCSSGYNLNSKLSQQEAVYWIYRRSRGSAFTDFPWRPTAWTLKKAFIKPSALRSDGENE